MTALNFWRVAAPTGSALSQQRQEQQTSVQHILLVAILTGRCGRTAASAKRHPYRGLANRRQYLLEFGEIGRFGEVMVESGVARALPV